jgi:hypothetical protein
VLRKIFGFEDEITKDWRKLHIDELYDLHSSRNAVKYITAWSRVLVKMLIVVWLSKNLSACYVTRRFITIFTGTPH